MDSEIKKILAVDFTAIWKMAGGTKSVLGIKNIWFSSIISFILLSVVLVVDAAKLVESLADLLIIVIPFYGALIAISVSGFFMIVANDNSNIIMKSVAKQIKQLKKREEELQYSFIQKATAKFALIVILEFVIGVILLISYLVIELKVTLENPDIVLVLNILLFYTIVWLVFYGIYLIFLLMKNTFIIFQSRYAIIFLHEHNKARDEDQSINEN